MKRKVIIDSCYFAGAQDDPVNVRNQPARPEKIDAQTLKLRFMHGQSYGSNVTLREILVAFVRAATMERFASGNGQGRKVNIWTE